MQNYTFSHMEQEVVVKDANEHDNKNDPEKVWQEDQNNIKTLNLFIKRVEM